MNWKCRYKNFVKIFFLCALTVLPTNQEPPEILKVPSTCKSVRCNKGYYCLVKVHNCSWGENCKRKIAKCVTEKEYYEANASCADFQCPDGHKCILRESLCTRPPCKVLKSCARNTAAENWFKKCKQLGCTSEYECFIRRPTDKCDNISCKHIPDCMLPPENELNKHCRGWVCPLKTECLAHIMGPCHRNDCQIFRTCRSTVPIKSRFKTLPDIEKEWFYQEEEKWRKQTMLTTPMSILDKVPGYERTKQLFFKPINTISSIQEDNNLEVLNRAHIVPNSHKAQEQKNPTSSSIWLNSLKTKSGIDVINFWIKEAEQNQHNLEFHEWLESIRETMGPEKYRIWLENVRLQTFHSKKFQDWLPIPVPIKNDDNRNFHQDFESKISDMEGEVLSAFPKSRFDDTFVIPEYGEQKDISTTMGPENGLSNNAAINIATLSKSSFVNTSEKAKNAIIPTFIIIQTSPQEMIPSVSGSQGFNHQIPDPSSSQMNSNQQFQVSQRVFRNFITPLPTYQYLPENDYQQIQSSPSFLRWPNLLNYSPNNEQSITAQLNENLIPANFLQNFPPLLPDEKSMILWYYPGFGYVNLQPQYVVNNNHDNESPIGINGEKNYFQPPKSNYHSRRRINWREFFKNWNKNDFQNLRHEEQIYEKSQRNEFLNDENSEIDDDKENEEEEIQFVKKILQDIIDYNFASKDEKLTKQRKNKENQKQKENQNRKENRNHKEIRNHKENRNKNENENFEDKQIAKIEKKNKKKKGRKNDMKMEIKQENDKENEKEMKKKSKNQNKQSEENENEKEIVDETEINSDDILIETLFNMIKDQLNNSQDNVTNIQLETLLDEIEKNENETQLLRDEFEKFFKNLENSEEEVNGT